MTHFAAKRWMLRQVTSYHHKYVKFGGQKHQRKIVVQIPRSSVDLFGLHLMLKQVASA